MALFLWAKVLERRGLAGGRPTLSGMKATARIGLPSAALSTGFSFVYVAIAPAIARFGTAQLAALAVGHRCESFAYQVGIGFAAASQALVGQRLGALRPDLARASARRAAPGSLERAGPEPRESRPPAESESERHPPAEKERSGFEVQGGWRRVERR